MGRFPLRLHLHSMVVVAHVEGVNLVGGCRLSGHRRGVPTTRDSDNGGGRGDSQSIPDGKRDGRTDPSPARPAALRIFADKRSVVPISAEAVRLARRRDGAAEPRRLPTCVG